MLLTELFQYLSLGSFIATSLVLVFLYKRFDRYSAKALAWFVFFNTFWEIESNFTRMVGEPNITHYYVYCGLETLFVPVLIIGLEEIRTYRKIILSLFVLLFLATVVEIYLVWPLRVNTITRFLECLFFVVLAVFTTRKLLHSPDGGYLFEMEEFWLCQGISIYFGIQAMVILVSNIAITKHEYEFGRKVWMFNSLASILSNCLLFYGIWKIYLRKHSLRQ